MNALIASWNTSDLQLIKYKESNQDGIPWIAINPDDKILYTVNWCNCCVINRFDSQTFEQLEDIVLPEGIQLPNEIQGGAFYKGLLYLSINAKDQIYSFNLTSSELKLELSDEMRNHAYEMEGLDFWDLTDKGLGVMHMYGNFMQLKEKSIRSYKP